jgi:hypothetical protein
MGGSIPTNALATDQAAGHDRASSMALKLLSGLMKPFNEERHLIGRHGDALVTDRFANELVQPNHAVAGPRVRGSIVFSICPTLSSQRLRDCRAQGLATREKEDPLWLRLGMPEQESPPLVGSRLCAKRAEDAWWRGPTMPQSRRLWLRQPPS